MGSSPLPIKPRIFARTRLVDTPPMATPCWEWTGPTNRGYAYMSARNKFRPAYRVSYEEFVGPVPDGLHLDHLCRNRACVNPSHLDPVTPAENVHRSLIARGVFGGRTGERRKAAQKRYRARKLAARGGPKPHANSVKTHCPKGHPYDEANTYIIPGSGSRTCRACARERRRK